MKKQLLILSLIIICFTGYSQTFDVNVKNLKGKKISFSELIDEKDTPIVVSFWATWCKPCIQELESINEDFEDWKDETNFKLYAISIDDSRSKHKVLPFVKSRDWEFEVYTDENSDLKRELNFVRVPFTCIIINKIIVWRKSGHTQGSEYEILETLKKLNK